MGGAQVQSRHQHPLNILTPKRGGGSQAGVAGTPTYIPQNDPLVALITLNKDTWGFEKKFAPWGVQSQQPGLGGWMGEVRRQKNFHVLRTYLDSLRNSTRME